MRLFKLVTLLFVLALPGCASVGREADALDAAQYAWSAAIRWGDFEDGLTMIDPEYQRAHPITPIELARYEQVQVSSYRDVGSDRDIAAGTAVRDIDIGVVNRHTLAERSVRYREQWRWDKAAGRWLLMGGLPDFWDGQ